MSETDKAPQDPGLAGKAAAPDAPPAPTRPSAPRDAARSGKAEAVGRAVDKWVDDHLRNSPLARHTPAWNFLQGKLSALKSILEQEL